jgi:hypothetical protein
MAMALVDSRISAQKIIIPFTGNIPQVTTGSFSDDGRNGMIIVSSVMMLEINIELWTVHDLNLKTRTRFVVYRKNQ